MDQSDEFKLTASDKEAIDIAREFGRGLLVRHDISAKDIISLGKALYAIDRLPESTGGVFVCFGLCLRAGDDNFSEMEYLDFEISEEGFSIQRGGSTYTKAVGSDSFSSPGYQISFYGDRETGCDLLNLRDLIRSLIERGASVSITDEYQDKLPWGFPDV